MECCYWVSEIVVTNSFLCDYQHVKKGTNGGVTKTGILAAAAAGSVIGLSFVLLGFSTTKCESSTVLKQLLVLPIATLAGLCGSLIDSLLGATLQFSGFCSVRRKVNLLTPSPPTKNTLSNWHNAWIPILHWEFVEQISMLLGDDYQGKVTIIKGTIEPSYFTLDIWYLKFITPFCRLLESQDQQLKGFLVPTFLTTTRWTLCQYCWPHFLLQLLVGTFSEFIKNEATVAKRSQSSKTCNSGVRLLVVPILLYSHSSLGNVNYINIWMTAVSGGTRAQSIICFLG